MKPIEDSIPYLQLPDTQAIRIITNISENMKENISYSTDPALQSLQQYIQFVAKEDLPITPENKELQSKCPVQRTKKFLGNIMGGNKTTEAALCPFVPGMNKKNLHYALLYNEPAPNFDDFYKTCFQELTAVQEHNNHKLATLYGIFSDPKLDTQEFSDALQMYCMKRKSEVIASGHMAGAMLSRHRPGGAERIFNKDTFSTKANNFKTQGFSYIAFRKLHYDDYGSMRTPENMQAFMQQFPGVAHQIKYIPQFIQFLEEKIKQDKEDIQLIEQMDPASIIIHYYEHHLMNCNHTMLVDFKKILEEDLMTGKKELEKIITDTEHRYRVYIQELKILEQETSNATNHLHIHP